MNNPTSFVSAVRRAWRSYARRPGFFAIAVSSLAIALGLATTIIAQIDSLRRPYTPVRDPDQTFMLSTMGIGAGGRRPAGDEVEVALRGTRVFERFVRVARGPSHAEVGRDVVASGAMLVGHELFQIVGLVPRLGRVFGPDEALESGVVVVSDGFWKRHFYNSPRIGDARVKLGNREYQVIGVAPPGWTRALNTDLWLPLSASPPPDDRYGNGQFIARVADGVSKTRAEAALREVGVRWTSVYGVSRFRFRFWLGSLRPDPLQIESFHVALMGAAAFILIIAAANVSALMLARSVGARRDQALRLALGAGRRDLIKDVVAEISILAVTGAVLGLVIAYAAMSVLKAFTPVEISWLGFAEPNLSLRVFGGLFGATFVSIALASLIPAAYVARIAPAEPLKESASTTTGRAHKRFQLLVVGEMALAMVLLFGASLISKTAHLISQFDFGYDARPIGQTWSNAVAVRTLSPPPADTLAAIANYTFRPELVLSDLDAIVGKLRQMEGVEAASWTAHDGVDRFVISDRKGTVDTGFYNPVLLNVGPQFFATLGLAIVEGRDFTEGDRTDGGAVILDQRSAAALFPNTSAVGRMVKLGPPESKLPWVPVVGVARDALHELPIYPEMTPPYVLYTTRYRPGMLSFVYRAKDGATDVEAAATGVLRDLLPPRSQIGAGRWIDDYREALAGRRFTAAIFTALSLAALALATAGLFGVLSYAVNQRMREFAIRSALGAQRRSIISLVMRDGAVMALGGTALGAFIGMYAAFVVYDWLWGVYPVDSLSLVIAEVVLLSVTPVAALIPALRATRANPAEVIRAQ